MRAKLRYTATDSGVVSRLERERGGYESMRREFMKGEGREGFVESFKWVAHLGSR